MIKLELGSGLNPMKGYGGIDKEDFGQRYTVDLEFERMLFDYSSVDAIYSRHFLEHLGDVKNVMNECWRVLKPIGSFLIYVPNGLLGSGCSPVHKQVISTHWFDFFKGENIWKEYGYRRWKILSLREVKNDIECELRPNK